MKFPEGATWTALASGSVRGRKTVQGKQYNATFPDTREGVEAAKRWLAKITLNKARASGVSTTLATCMAEYLDRMARNKPTSVNTYRKMLDRFVRQCPRWANTPIGRLRASTMEEIGKDIAPWAYSVRGQFWAVANGALRTAAKDGLIDPVPMPDGRYSGRPKKGKYAKVDDQTLDRLSYVLPPFLSLAPHAGAWMGVRTGEYLAWTEDAMHLEAEVPYVEIGSHVSANMGTPMILGWTKDTGEEDDPRFIHLVPEMVTKMRAFRARHNPAANPGGLWAVTVKGGPRLMSQDNFRHHWNGACDRVLGQRLEFRFLRHVYVSTCLDAGVAPMVLRSWTGHDDANIEAHYAHPEMANMADNVRRLHRAI